MRSTTMTTAGLLIAVLLLAGRMTYAVDAEHGWTTGVAPYAWLATLSGDLTSRGSPVHISESIGDIPDVLDFGGMLVVESAKNRAAILFDTAYVKVSDSRATSGLNMTQSVTGIAGAYTVLLPEGSGPAVDVLAGIRYWNVESAVNVSGTYQTERQDWVDQFLGARARWVLSKKLLLTVRGDVGGFGVESKWVWNAIGTVQYSFSDTFSAGAGYRALYGHYEHWDASNKFEYDATLAGPVIGALFTF